LQKTKEEEEEEEEGVHKCITIQEITRNLALIGNVRSS
jgi:hypothetical protein